MQSKSILLFLLGSSLFFTSCKKTEEAPASTEQKTETTATETPASNDVSNITTTPAPAAPQTAPARRCPGSGDGHPAAAAIAVRRQLPRDGGPAKQYRTRPFAAPRDRELCRLRPRIELRRQISGRNSATSSS